MADGSDVAGGIDIVGVVADGLGPEPLRSEPTVGLGVGTAAAGGAGLWAGAVAVGAGFVGVACGVTVDWLGD